MIEVKEKNQMCAFSHKTGNVVVGTNTTGSTICYYFFIIIIVLYGFIYIPAATKGWSLKLK